MRADMAPTRQLEEAVRRFVGTYIVKHADDLLRVWETERPFELHLPTAIISGRADVTLDKEGGQIQSLASVDYKTSTNPGADEDYGLQLAIYTNAGRREGLNLRAAYVHDLKAADRQPVDVSPPTVLASEQTVESSVQDLKDRDFQAKPGSPCRRCDVKAYADGPYGHRLMTDTRQSRNLKTTRHARPPGDLGFIRATEHTHTPGHPCRWSALNRPRDKTRRAPSKAALCPAGGQMARVQDEPAARWLAAAKPTAGRPGEVLHVRSPMVGCLTRVHALTGDLAPSTRERPPIGGRLKRCGCRPTCLRTMAKGRQ